MGHYPIRLLVSCKKYRRKLNQLDIDHFAGELSSSNALLGVLYSYSGFVAAAVEKARMLGISCCRLYRNQPADLPEVLAFPSFLFTQRYQISVDSLELADGSRWSDLLELKVHWNSQEITILELANEALQSCEQAVLADMKRDMSEVRQSYISELSCIREGRDFKLRAVLGWRAFKGRVEAHLVSGSYCQTSGEFLGQQTTPIIDLKGPEPGPGWEPIELSTIDWKRQAIFAYLCGANFEQSLRNGLGPTLVRQNSSGRGA